MRRFQIAALAVTMTIATPIATWAQPVQGDYAGALEVVASYKAALEKLDITGVEKLFAPDAQIFENGGVEGNFDHYRDHHLGPELKAFKAFSFSDYKASVRGEGDVALVTETYTYTIILANDEKVERAGVATTLLKRSNGQWQIVSAHSSSRKPKPKT